jgi:hypothetical protein
MVGEACVQRGGLYKGRLVYKGARLVYRGRDSSVEDKTRLRRGRLVYRGGDSSTVQRARLFCGGIYSYTEGETSLWRGRLVYGGGDSSTERETRLGTEICTFFTFTLVRQTCFADNFFVCIFLQLFQRIRNQREILRFFISFFIFFQKILFWGVILALF